MECFKGPLGSHRNYIAHIVLPNCVDYFNTQKRNEELNNVHTPSKYEEMRYFLNAIESMNNILDYYYYENEISLKVNGLQEYKNKIMKKHPVIRDVSNLANAYKHCVRENRGKKNANLPWAKDLQRPQLVVDVDIKNVSEVKVKEDIKVNVDYKFDWPIENHEKIFIKSFKFWVSYGNSDGPNLSCV